MKSCTLPCFACAPCATRGTPMFTYACCHCWSDTAATFVANFCFACVTRWSHLSAAAAAATPGAFVTAFAPAVMRSAAALRFCTHLAVAAWGFDLTGIAGLSICVCGWTCRRVPESARLKRRQATYPGNTHDSRSRRHFATLEVRVIGGYFKGCTPTLWTTFRPVRFKPPVIVRS